MNIIKYFKTQQRTISKLNKEWLLTKTGSWFRIGLFGGTVVIYPFYIILANGPLLKYTFSWKHNVDYDLPNRLQKLINEQYEKWLNQEGRTSNKAIINFGVQNFTESLDSVAAGSVGVRFGARVALPFFTRFTTKDELEMYCKKNLEPFFLFNKIPICLIWESKQGQELISTFLISDNAIRFLIARDLFENDGYNAFCNKAISWATWTSFASFFAYWFHNSFTKGTILSFTIIYAIFIALTLYGCYEWHYLYKHMNSCHADKMSAKLSTEHAEGGKEYYYKLLKINRILRSLLEKKGDHYFSPVGDLRKAVTPLLIRFEHLKDINVEDDEIRPAIEGDDY